MQNIKGQFIQPDENWKDSLISFCDGNGISRDGWSIEKDCVPKNCIEMDGNIYIVDIDYKWILTDA